MKSTRSGPIALVDDGARIMRTGKGGIDVWNVEGLPDHGPQGARRIGRGRVNTENTWRDLDMGDEVKLSTGTPPATDIKFGDKHLAIDR